MAASQAALTPEDKALAEAIGTSVAAKMGKVIISVDLPLFFTALQVRKVITPLATATPLTVPPLTTIVLTQAVPAGQTYIQSTYQFAFDQDEVFSINTVFDNNAVSSFTDPLLYRMGYLTPILFSQVGALPYAQRQIVTTITNLSSAYQNIVLYTGAALMNNQSWQAIIDNFFDIIENIISSQEALEALNARRGTG